MGENREIGKNNQLLWDIPEDMKHFRTITSGHPVIMGRKTYESIGRPLPKRTNIIISRDPQYKIEGCSTVTNLEAAIQEAKKENTEIFIIGGGQIYKEGMKYADKLYITIVHQSFDADTFFPDFSHTFIETKRESQENEQYSFDFIELERKKEES